MPLVAGAFAICALAELGCTGHIGPASTDGEASMLTVIEGAPVGSEPVEQSSPESLDSMRAWSSLRGALAIGTDDGVWVSSALNPGSFAPLNVVGTDDEPTATGAVQLLASRGDGLLAWADNGLFHESEGFLLRSPLSPTLADWTVHGLDTVVEDDHEALWFATDAGVFRWMDDTLRWFDALPQAEALVALDAQRAIAVWDGDAYFIDGETGTTVTEMTGVGEVLDVARRIDKSVFLATTTGLWGRRPEGAWMRWTFADAHDDAQPAFAVAAAFDQVFVALDDSVVSATPDGSAFLAEVAGATALVEDGAGDVWVANPAALTQLATGQPVSFAADVVPFMTAHCTRCHDDGASNAPALALTDLSAVRGMAQLLEKRLLANGSPPMPPANEEILKPRDYAIVIRWIAGGKLP